VSDALGVPVVCSLLLPRIGTWATMHPDRRKARGFSAECHRPSEVQDEVIRRPATTLGA
jgi:hypothetical protein